MAAAIPSVLSVGIACIDSLTYVDGYPFEDSKCRALDHRMTCGGNALNSSVTIARLSTNDGCENSDEMRTRVSFLTVVGELDSSTVVAHLDEHGVDTRYVVQSAGTPCARSTIIVSRRTGTRTCMHVPFASHSLAPTHPLVERACASVRGRLDLVSLDGRLPAASVRIAQAAIEADVRLLLDCERERPALSLLIGAATHLVVNESFAAYVGGGEVVEGVVRLLQAKSHEHINLSETSAWGGGGQSSSVVDARWREKGFVIATLGARGALLVRRRPPDSRERTQQCDDYCALWSECVGGGEPVVARGMPVVRLFTVRTDTDDDDDDDGGGGGSIEFVHVSASLPLNESAVVVDTTGCGDVFVGSVAFALAHRFAGDVRRMLRLASAAAGHKSCFGTRGGANVQSIRTLESLDLRNGVL